MTKLKSADTSYNLQEMTKRKSADTSYTLTTNLSEMTKLKSSYNLTTNPEEFVEKHGNKLQSKTNWKIIIESKLLCIQFIIWHGMW